MKLLLYGQMKREGNVRMCVVQKGLEFNFVQFDRIIDVEFNFERKEINFVWLIKKERKCAGYRIQFRKTA